MKILMTRTCVGDAGALWEEGTEQDATGNTGRALIGAGQAVSAEPAAAPTEPSLSTEDLPSAEPEPEPVAKKKTAKKKAAKSDGGS